MSVLLYKASMPIMPIGINRSYKVGTSQGRGKMYHSQEAKDFQNEAYFRFKDAKYAFIDEESITLVAKEKTPLELQVTFYLKRRGQYETSLYKRDIDSGVKATLDELFDFLDLNDKLVVDMSVKKRVATQEPHIYLELRTLDLEDIRKDTKDYGEMFV